MPWNLAAISGEGCDVPSPHMLMRAMGKKIVLKLHHSSALTMPAAASPKLCGTEFSHKGTSVSLMTCLIRDMTSGVEIFNGGSPVAWRGFLRRYITTMNNCHK